VPFALQFSGKVDPTALATFILALVTLVAVTIAAIALRRTQEELMRSREEIDRAHRPVVVPIHDPNHRPAYLGHGQLIVPVENIGAGPALDLTVYVTPRDENGGVSPAWGEHRQTGAAAGLGASEVTLIEVRVWGVDGLPSYDTWISFKDVAGKEWVSAAKYRPSEDGSRYTNMWVAAVPPGTDVPSWLGFESVGRGRARRAEPRTP
jgi:hypothetical protein